MLAYFSMGSVNVVLCCVDDCVPLGILPPAPPSYSWATSVEAVIVLYLEHPAD